MKCFKAHEKFNISCKKVNCKHWIDCDSFQNCTLIAAKNNGPMTLQEIGSILGVTRMRICQIEKKVLTKLSTMIESETVAIK
tara:strand:- start:177 stop:422 length:246 start_codon:yes stop_codon:yes gene_type:complete